VSAHYNLALVFQKEGQKDEAVEGPRYALGREMGLILSANRGARHLAREAEYSTLQQRR
jgi:hypothetical protein